MDKGYCFHVCRSTNIYTNTNGNVYKYVGRSEINVYIISWIELHFNIYNNNVTLHLKIKIEKKNYYFCKFFINLKTFY